MNTEGFNSNRGRDSGAIVCYQTASADHVWNRQQFEFRVDRSRIGRDGIVGVELIVGKFELIDEW